MDNDPTLMFEGRPLELGDHLLYRKDDTSAPIKTQLWGVAISAVDSRFTLTNRTPPRRARPTYLIGPRNGAAAAYLDILSRRPDEYDVTLEELLARCTRDPD